MEIRQQEHYAVLPSDLKRSNRMQILEMFKSGEAVTVNEIAEKIGVSRQTVMKAVQFFIGKGLIVSAGKAESGKLGGKRAELFELCMEQYFLSVVLWPDSIHVVLMNVRGEVIDSMRPMLTAENCLNIDSVLEGVGETIRVLMYHNRISDTALRGLCISTTGTVDYERDSLKYTSRVPQWGSDIPIAEKLRPYLPEGLPIVVENVAKVVAHAVLHVKGRTNKHVVTLFSSWDGISASFIDNDRILSGRHSLIGEVGHMVLRPDETEVCACGQRGCLEYLVSRRRLRKAISEAKPHFPESALYALSEEEIDIPSLFEASKTGDALARSLVDRFADYFAVLLRNITVMFDPEVVILHGEFAMSDDYFRERVFEKMSCFRYAPPERSFEMVLDKRPIDRLNLIGANIMLLDKLFSDERLYI